MASTGVHKNDNMNGNPEESTPIIYRFGKKLEKKNPRGRHATGVPTCCGGSTRYRYTI